MFCEKTKDMINGKTHDQETAKRQNAVNITQRNLKRARQLLQAHRGKDQIGPTHQHHQEGKQENDRFTKDRQVELLPF